MTKHLTTAVAVAALVLTPGRAAAQSAPTFDHSAFDPLLRAHVAEDGLVDYDALATSDQLDRYLATLAAAPLDALPEEERLALWINAYNAYTIALILRHDERESIRNINRTLGLFAGKGPWKERFATVAGRTYTLDEIEHEIIRVRFDEPRIHFALVCAAMGCPPLRREAYTGDRLDAQLEDQARRFLTEEPDKNRVDPATRTVHLSPIFDWYREDFPAGTAELGGYLDPLLSRRFRTRTPRERRLRGPVHRLRLGPECTPLKSCQRTGRQPPPATAGAAARCSSGASAAPLCSCSAVAASSRGCCRGFWTESGGSERGRPSPSSAPTSWPPWPGYPGRSAPSPQGPSSVSSRGPSTR